MQTLKDISATITENNICVRCISDTTCTGIYFDAEGICNYCHLHDKWAKIYPNDARGRVYLDSMIKKIKNDGKGKKYDCIIGISGGRDSSYLLYIAKTQYHLRPLAVHFNDGFDNPVAGKNMWNALKKLDIPLETITSNWAIARDLKISFLKASTPELNEGTDVGIGAACYGVASKYGIQHILFGQSFRTEGIKPISWAYFEGKYLASVQKKFGTVPLSQWSPNNPGYRLAPQHLLYYMLVKGIRLHAPLYYENYIRKDAEEIMKRELDWEYPGAHYYDDLYWSLITYVHRIKFNIDFRLNSYSALIRDGQMNRDEALEKVKHPYVIEDPKVIALCLKRLDISTEDFETWLALPPRKFYDYPNAYATMKAAKPLIRLLCEVGILPVIVYDKYFLCGK